MSSKRSLEGSAAPAPKKQKKGFQVGPANLPDGSWKRKNQRIKRHLIEKAQIKRSYAKLKEREGIRPSNVRYENHDDNKEDAETTKGPRKNSSDAEPSTPEPAGLELHPERQQLVDAANDNESRQKLKQQERPLKTDDRRTPNRSHDKRVEKDEEDEEEEEEEEEDANTVAKDEAADVDPRQHPDRRRRNHHMKPQPFLRETREAERRRTEAEQRAREREEAWQMRERKLEERERHRRAMAKARTGGRNGQRKLGRESRVLLDKVKRLMGKE